MTAEQAGSAAHFKVICVACEREILARPAWVGRLIQCPHCQTPMRVPPPATDRPATRGVSVGGERQRCFNFACPRCDSLLEAHTGLVRHEATCPTCGAKMLVPTINPNTGRPDAVTLLTESPDELVPMHAYAASGKEAPVIRYSRAGEPYIICASCGSTAAIDANHCQRCGAPFTLEGAPTAAPPGGSTLAWVALAVAVFALPTAHWLVIGITASIMAAIARGSGSRLRRPVIANTALALGLASIGLGIAYHVLRWLL
jgi:DNA-directed RNA polymerase subunit RPC12/RpoP